MYTHIHQDHATSLITVNYLCTVQSTYNTRDTDWMCKCEKSHDAAVQHCAVTVLSKIHRFKYNEDKRHYCINLPNFFESTKNIFQSKVML